MKKHLLALMAVMALGVGVATVSNAQVRTYSLGALVASSGSATSSSYQNVAVNRNAGSPYYGYVYICQTAGTGAPIVKIYKPTTPAGTSFTDAGLSVTPSSLTVSSFSPMAVDIGSDDTVWVLNSNLGYIDSATHPNAGSTSVQAVNRIQMPSASKPRSIAIVGPYNGARVYASSVTEMKLYAYDCPGSTAVTTATWTYTSAYNSYGVVADDNGFVYIARSGASLVRRVRAVDGLGATDMAPLPTGAAAVSGYNDLRFVRDAAYSGGGYLISTTRNGSASPYKLTAYRYRLDGTYIDGWGQSQPSVANYTTLDVPFSGQQGTWMGVDNLGRLYARSVDGSNYQSVQQVTYTPLKPVVNKVTVTPAKANPGSSVTVTAEVTQAINDLSSVTVDLSAFGGSATTSLTNQTPSGNGSFIYSGSFTVPAGQTPNVYPIAVTVTDTNNDTGTGTSNLGVGSSVVISQIYGGPGNPGSTYANDFIELYNKSATTVSLSGWTVQYAANTGLSWSTTALTGTIGPGQYYLIQEAAGGTGGASLPTPDATGTISMSGSSAKVALVASNIPLSVSNPVGTGNVIDFVGYGTANAWEGSGAAPLTYPYATTSDIRDCNNTDTDNNSADFALCTPPLPRNSTMSNPPLTITEHPSSQSVCAGDFAILMVGATGVPPISYQWYTGTPGSGTLIDGATDSAYFAYTAGSYYVKVSTACESQDSNAATVNVKNPASVGTPVASPVALSAGMSTNVTVDVTPGTDPVSSVTAVVNRTGAVTANLTNTGGNTWTGPVAIPTGAASGSATITVTAADGTCNNATNAVGVNVNAITAWVADATASPVHSSPVAVNGIVYYGDDLGRLWAYTISATPTAVAGLNPFDTRTKGAGSGAQILGRPLVRIEGGTPFVYVVTSNGYLFKVNATDGTQPWGAPALLLVTATTVSTTPAVFNTGDSSLPAQDFVFVGAGDGTNAYLYKVRASDGVLADTSISLGTDTKSSPAVGAGSVYIGVTGGADGVLRLNPVDLEILTNLAAGKTASGAPFISATTDIGRPYPVAYVSTDDGTIYAVNATTGALETTFGSGGSVALSITPATGLTPLSSNLFVYGNVLYVGANDNKVYAVNSTTGAVSTFFDAGGSQKAIKHGVAVDPGGSGNTGNLVFGSTDGCFYQIPLANPVAYSVFKVTDPAFYTVSTSPTIDLVGGYNLAGDDFSNVNIFPRF